MTQDDQTVKPRPDLGPESPLHAPGYSRGYADYVLGVDETARRTCTPAWEAGFSDAKAHADFDIEASISRLCEREAAATARVARLTGRLADLSNTLETTVVWVIVAIAASFGVGAVLGVLAGWKWL